ncbi:MAG: TolC family outer membrane protein [Gammaproteobacteria bacterium]
MKRAIGVALFSWLAATSAGAADLMSVYQDALANDPTIRQADAIRKATREIKPQGWARLLPQITGQGQYTRGETESNQATPQSIFDPDNPNGPPIGSALVPRKTTLHPDNNQWSIDLRQNLFSWTNWATLREADIQVAQAEADYRTAQQNLLQRVAARYFGVLSAQDALEAQQVALEAFNRQLDQANKRFDVGLIAITDVQESKAARDQSTAGVIQAKRTLATAEEQLREVTGQKYDRLSRPGAEMPLASPQPADEQAWVDMSMDQNTALLSSRLASDIARENVRIAFGGHLPTLDLVGSYGKSDGNGSAEISGLGRFDPFPSDGKTKTYGLQVQVPIFAGGGTQSRVREQQFRWIAAKEQVTATSRQTERLARDAYLGVISEISRVEALKQGFESSQTSLKATEAGYEVGTRTSVDVLDQRRLLVNAQTAYLQSRYDYLQNVVNLRLAAGNLDPQTLEDLNKLLTETVQAAPTQPNAPPPPR